VTSLGESEQDLSDRKFGLSQHFQKLRATAVFGPLPNLNKKWYMDGISRNQLIVP
jgi:hypothetical protein